MSSEVPLFFLAKKAKITLILGWAWDPDFTRPKRKTEKPAAFELPSPVVLLKRG